MRRPFLDQEETMLARVDSVTPGLDCVDQGRTFGSRQSDDARRLLIVPFTATLRPGGIKGPCGVGMECWKGEEIREFIFLEIGETNDGESREK